MEFSRLPAAAPRRNAAPAMPDSPPDSPAAAGELLPAVPDTGDHALAAPPTLEGRHALERAQAFARQATAPATLRAYKADWQHFADWCAAPGFVPVPAEPAVVGAYLASLAESHAPSTIRRRLAAIGKMHRFNDLPWNPGAPRHPGAAARPAAPARTGRRRRRRR